MTETKEILRTLTSAPGVSGTERGTAEQIAELMKPYAREIRTGPLGDLICTLAPGKEKSVMLVAHMDKIGLVVTSIDEKSGMLRFAKCGGTDIRTLTASRVKVYGKRTLDGVVISVPPHLAKTGTDRKAVPAEESAVDCGLPYEEISRIVSVGDRIEVRLPFSELSEETVSSPYIDNTAGCAAVILAAKLLSEKELPCTVHAVFSTREEVGKAGAMTTAFALQPDEALVADVGFARQHDVSSVQATPAGSGAQIGYAPAVPKEMSETLKAVAEKNGIPYTTVVSCRNGGRTTGTDADVVSTAGQGVKTGIVTIPLKYMHTPVETVVLSDIEAAARLMAAFVLREGADENDV